MVRADHLGEPSYVLLQDVIPRDVRLNVGEQCCHIDLEKDSRPLDTQDETGIIRKNAKYL